MEKRKRFPKIDEASLLETMLAAPDELIVVVNKNGYIENMSQAYGDFLGIQVQNAIGRHVTEVIENTRMDIVVKTGSGNGRDTGYPWRKDDCHPNSNPKKRNGDWRVWARFGAQYQRASHAA